MTSIPSVFASATVSTIDDAAIDGDDECHACVLEILQRFLVKTVAFVVSVGNVIIYFDVADALEKVPQHYPTRNAVCIVVTIDENILTTTNACNDALSRLAHPFHEERIMQIELEVRMQKLFCRLLGQKTSVIQEILQDWMERWRDLLWPCQGWRYVRNMTYRAIILKLQDKA